MDTTAAAPDPFDVPFGHEEVLRGRSEEAVRDEALVLRAAGIQHAIQTSGAGARIVVGLLDAERAASSSGTTSRKPGVAPAQGAPPASGRTAPQRAALRRGDRGHALDAVPRRLRRGLDVGGAHGGRGDASGEGWRAITALTLHVDLDHLVSNLVFGGLFGILAARLSVRGRLAGNRPRRDPRERARVLPRGSDPPGHRRVHRDLRDARPHDGCGVGPAQARRRAVGQVAPPSARPCSSAGSASATARAADVLTRTTGFLSGALIGWTVARTRLPERLGRGGGLLGLGAIGSSSAGSSPSKADARNEPGLLPTPGPSEGPRERARPGSQPVSIGASREPHARTGPGAVGPLAAGARGHAAKADERQRSWLTACRPLGPAHARSRDDDGERPPPPIQRSGSAAHAQVAPARALRERAEGSVSAATEEDAWKRVDGAGAHARGSAAPTAGLAGLTIAEDDDGVHLEALHVRVAAVVHHQRLPDRRRREFRHGSRARAPLGSSRASGRRS